MKPCAVCREDAYFVFPYVVYPKHWPKGRCAMLCERCKTILDAVVMLEGGEGFFNTADNPHVEPVTMLERLGFLASDPPKESACSGF